MCAVCFTSAQLLPVAGAAARYWFVNRRSRPEPDGVAEPVGEPDELDEAVRVGGRGPVEEPVRAEDSVPVGDAGAKELVPVA